MSKHNDDIIIPQLKCSSFKADDLTKVKISKIKPIDMSFIIKPKINERPKTKFIINEEQHPNKLMDLNTINLPTNETISYEQIFKIFYEQSSVYIYHNNANRKTKLGIGIPIDTVNILKFATKRQLYRAMSIYVWEILESNEVRQLFQFPYTELFMIDDYKYEITMNLFVVYDKEIYHKYEPEGNYSRYIKECMDKLPLKFVGIEQQCHLHICCAKTELMKKIIGNLENDYGKMGEIQTILRNIFKADNEKTYGKYNDIAVKNITSEYHFDESILICEIRRK